MDWTDETWAMLDTVALGRAFRREDDSEKARRTKLMSGWQNVGRQRHRINSQVTDSCPCCGQADETQCHVLTCRSQSANKTSRNALRLFRQKLAKRKTNPFTIDAIIKGIRWWMHDPIHPPTVQDISRDFTDNVASSIRQAIQEQTTIGWENFLRGFVSKQWAEAQRWHCHETHQDFHPNAWAPGLIKTIWDYSLALWDDRNNTLHNGTAVAGTSLEELTRNQIRDLYGEQDIFPSKDKDVYFHVPLQERLNRPRRQNMIWLKQVTRLRDTLDLQAGQIQTRLTAFYTRT
jgi:hypothetical protein